MATRGAQELIRAARSGNAEACLRLGQLYVDGGGGMAANPTAAMMWLARARKGGHPEAARVIAEKLPIGIASASSDGMNGDYLAACREAAMAGSPSANFSLGEIFGQLGKHAAAIDHYRSAADAGHAAAARRLGELLLSGAKESSPDVARRWLEEAVARGDKDAIRPLADLLWRLGDEAAEPWLRQLAEGGDTEAMIRFAERLLGASTDQRIKEARTWLVRAARRDHPRALWLLGRLHVRRWLHAEERCN